MKTLLCLAVLLLCACQAEGVGSVDGGTCPAERPHLVDQVVCCAWGMDGAMDDCEDLVP
jgi:hypothetical protein